MSALILRPACPLCEGEKARIPPEHFNPFRPGTQETMAAISGARLGKVPLIIRLRCNFHGRGGSRIAQNLMMSFFRKFANRKNHFLLSHSC